MPGHRSLYDVLNVAPEAEPVVIEAAYKALIKRYHPDQAEGGAPTRDAAKINQAFALLKDPARRAEYDHRLWTRQQSLRLAELNGLDRPRAPRLFGWTGWLVAGLLAAALASLVASGQVVPSNVKLAASAGEPPRSNEALVRASAAKAADAEEAKLRSVMPSSASILASVRAENREYGRPVIRQVPEGAGPPRKPRARQRAPRPAREDPDFLERQGYIY